MISVGLDLAGSQKRNTGFCRMDSALSCRTAILHTDEEILAATAGASPDVVSIDAPLFLPLGRESLERKGPPHFRECDRELQRMHIRFFPISLGPMRMLTARGMRLKKEFESEGLSVIESFPGAVQDILGMPRKQDGLEELQSALVRYGVGVAPKDQTLSGDELDGISSALVGMLYLQGNYRAIGDPREGFMILPKARTT